MNKKIKILLIILGAILMIFIIIYSLKLWIANYVIIFSNNEKLNYELNIDGDALIILLKTQMWYDSSRDFEIFYIEPYFQIKHKKIDSIKLSSKNSGFIEEHNATGKILLGSLVLLLLYAGIIFIVINNKYTNEQIKRIKESKNINNNVI